MSIFNEFFNLIPLIVAVLCAMAFIVSVIVQVTKEVWVIQKVPTKTWTLIVSIVICPIAYLVYIAYINMQFTWYCLIAIIISGFPVSYIATYGWDSFNDLWKRFKR
jgi:ABC-type multidrug transport system fused ATPase/permease subunit